MSLSRSLRPLEKKNSNPLKRVLKRTFKRVVALFKVFQKEAIPVVVFKRGKEEFED